MEKKKNGVLILLGICILIAGSLIGSGLSNVADSIYQLNTDGNNGDDSHRVIVQDGIIYMYDTVSGEVWRKADKPDSKWEEVEYLFGD